MDTRNTTVTARGRILVSCAALFAAATVSAAALAAPGVEERSTAVAPVPAGADPVVVFEQFQRFQAQVEALTGRIEELEHALAQSREQSRANYDALDQRVSVVEEAAKKASADAAAVTTAPGQSVAPGVAPLAGAPTSAPATASATVPSTIDAAAAEQALLDKALAQVREKKYDDAIKAFEAQLKQYPRGELAPVAMYWLGEMWLVASVPDAAKAGRYFYRVYNEYPKSPRASLAMYRNGMLQCEAGDIPKARVILNKVLIQYPDSADAKSAESALKGRCK